MKKDILCILLISLVLFIYSFERIKHGCLDSNATNYTENANFDNNSCCCDCYIGETFHGNFCGPDALEIEANGYEEYAQVYSDNGIPTFNADGTPNMAWQYFPVDCEGL